VVVLVVLCQWIEWAKDGITGELFIVQARPETVESGKSLHALENHVLDAHSEVITTGKSVGGKIGSGTVRVIMHPEQMHELKAGEVLVTDITDPDWEPVMKRASAIVTNRGGRTCHAAIIARELGIAAIVGTHDGSQLMKTGDEVTVSCAEGDTGYVYKGLLPHRIEKIDMDSIPKPEKNQDHVELGEP
jgi:pyruvate,water dikinase